MSDRPLSSFRREVAAGVRAARHGIELAESKVGIADVSAKEGRDIFTASDVAVEELVRRLLSESLGHPVVGEEQGVTRPSDGSAYWFVDPICGTRNYASGMSLYCLNLAFVQGTRSSPPAGRIAAYVLFSISAVHCAAGSLLVTEAGGMLSEIDGQAWTIDSPTMLASANQVVHSELLEISALA